MISGCRGAYRN